MIDLETISNKLDQLLEKVSAASTIQRYLSIAQAASYAGVSEESIRRLLGSGKLSAYRPVGGRVVIDLQQLNELILASEQQQSGRGVHHPQSAQPGGAHV